MDPSILLNLPVVADLSGAHMYTISTELKKSIRSGRNVEFVVFIIVSPLSVANDHKAELFTEAVVDSYPFARGGKWWPLLPLI